MWEKLKTWAVEQVVWAERNMKDRTGKEKRNAVVQKLDAMIVLPPFLEPFDGPIIGFFVDMAVEKLNTKLGHHFGEGEVSAAQEAEVEASMDIPADMAKALEGAK